MENSRLKALINHEQKEKLPLLILHIISITLCNKIFILLLFALLGVSSSFQHDCKYS